MANRTRHNWEAITTLYNLGYNTQDIAAITGTSAGTISKGLKERGLTARSQGKGSMAINPKDFSANQNKLLQEANLLVKVDEYYNKVAILFKISHIYRYSNERTRKEIASELNTTENEVKILRARGKRLMADYEEGLKDLSDKEKNKIIAKLIGDKARNLRTSAYASNSINKNIK